MNVHVLYVLELTTGKKNSVRPSVRPSIHPSVRLSVCMCVRTLGRLQNLSGCAITFEGVSKSNQNLVGVVYV